MSENIVNNQSEQFESIFEFEFIRFFSRFIKNIIFLIIFLVIGLIISYLVNRYSSNTYLVSSKLYFKDNTGNPFTTNTGINLIWGDDSDKVNFIKNTITTRPHLDKVVKKLNLDIEVYRVGKAVESKIYKEEIPFNIIKKNKYAYTDKPFNFDLSYKDNKININYEGKEIYVENNSYFKINGIDFILNITQPHLFAAYPYRVTVDNYMNKTSAIRDRFLIKSEKNSSIIDISFEGDNQLELIDIINTSNQVLIDSRLEKSNYLANKTIEYIDEQLKRFSKQIDSTSNALGKIKKQNKIISLDNQIGNIQADMTRYRSDEYELEKKINILRGFQKTLSYTNVQQLLIPSIIDISDTNLTSYVRQLSDLYQQRGQMLETLTEQHPDVIKLDFKINNTKKLAKNAALNLMKQLNTKLNQIRGKIGNTRSKIAKLPDDEIEYINTDVFVQFNRQQYGRLLEKKTNAELFLVGNIPDLEVMEPAVLIDVIRTAPNKKLNVIIGILLPILLYLLLILILEILDAKVRTINDVVKKTKIPLISILGSAKNHVSSLVVLDHPKSSIAEAFRALRSNIQFLFTKRDNSRNKTILTTSTIGGEGKTFIAMNIASVLSLSNKKTILIGMDLRKPRIFGDFGIKNDIGLTNYLIGQKNKTEIIQPTKISSLSIITAGPIPPNPSELLMGKALDTLIEELKQEYDYIVLDTPPVGLVSDALELMKFTDVNIYVVRHNYSFRNSIGLISNKFDKGEIKNVGIVINDFKVSGKNGYGYGYFEEDETYKKYGGALEKIKSLFKRRK